MKYIDSDKLIAEIERLLEEAKNDEEKAFAKIDAAGHLAAVTKTTVCVKIKKLITSLQQEQPEVDLEKEIDNWLDAEPHMVRDTAIHFYEIGLKAKKEECTKPKRYEILSWYFRRKLGKNPKRGNSVW